MDDKAGKIRPGKRASAIEVMIARFLPNTPFGRIIGKMVHGIVGLFGIKLFNMFLVYLTAVLMARTLGPTDFGLYNFGTAIANFVIIPVIFGLNNLVLRETVWSMANRAFGLARGVLLFGNILVLVNTVLAVALMHLIVWIWPNLLSPDLQKAALIGIWIVPFLALTRVWAAAVKALHRTISSMVPEMVIRPILFLAALGLFYWLFGSPSFEQALYMQVGIGVFALLGGFWIWQRARPSETLGVKSEMQVRTWLLASAPLMMLASARLFAFATDRVMLGILSTPEDVGIYTVATRNAQLVMLVLGSLDIVLSSFIAEQFAKGDKATTLAVLRKITRFVFVLTIAAGIVLYFSAPIFLELFGPEFQAAQGPFGILLIDKILGSAMGSVAIILAMTGQEKKALLGLWIAAVLNVLLNYLLIPPYGMYGAAVATVISGLFWKFTLTYNVLRNVGIDPSIFGFLTKIVPPHKHVVDWETIAANAKQAKGGAVDAE